MENINYNEVRNELKRKNLYDIQKELTSQRRSRTAIMSFLIFALVFTFIFGTLEDPFIYTLSNIGNFFSYRIVFIIWSMIAGLAIVVAIIALFKLEGYKKKGAYISVYLAAFFLIATGVIPALKDTYPFWHFLHTVTSGVLAVFLYIALVPFSIWISKENPRLRISIIVWQIVIWIGSILVLILYLHSALFEIWFFVSTILFLLYLCLVLFEESIIKRSVKLMMNEKNLNVAIEKIFIDLDIASKRQNKINREEG